MKRKFYFEYYFNSYDYQNCFRFNITQKNIENSIKSYIKNNSIWEEDTYSITSKYNEDTQIDFSIVDITDCEFTIDVDKVWSMKEYLREE